MNKLRHQYRLPCLLSLTLATVGVGNSVWAADGKWEVKSGDTIENIVSQQYAGYSNRTAIMDAIRKANPQSFINNDLNRVIIGKTLILPDASKIQGLNVRPPVTPPAQPTTVDATQTQARLKTLETQLTQLQDTLKSAETENVALKEQVAGFESEKHDKGEELTKLEARIKELETLNQNAANTTVQSTAENTASSDSATDTELGTLKAELAKNQQALTEQQQSNDVLKQQVEEAQQQTTGLREQVADLSRQNDALQNDLSQTRTAVEAAEKKAEHSALLPWVLLGLLALLVLPLLWLLKRKREEPVIATVTAPVAVEPISVVAKVEGETTATKEASREVEPIAAIAPAGVVSTESALSPDVIDSNEISENPDVDLKLDIARAYLDLRDSNAAAEILQEVMTEGDTRQRQEAREILSFIA